MADVPLPKNAAVDAAHIAVAAAMIAPESRDEVIEQVRAVREAYAARFDYDIAALFRHAQESAKQSKRKVVRRQPKAVNAIGA